MVAAFKLGMAQMRVDGGQIADNLLRAKGFITEAAARGCQIVVLPECLDVGWTHPVARDLAEPIPGKTSDALCRAARKANIHVVAGLTERSGDKRYNAAILIDPSGQILLKHRKINILDIAQDLYSIGDTLGVAETSLGVIGVNICADNFANSLAIGHTLARMGAQMILSPCAWAVPADHDNEKDPYGETWRVPYAKLATSYDMTVVGVSNVGAIEGGPWDGRNCIGCSLAMGPDGEVLTQLPYGAKAEMLEVIEVCPVARATQGTDISPMLRNKET